MKAARPCRGRDCDHLRDRWAILCQRCWRRVPIVLRDALSIARKRRRAKLCGPGEEQRAIEAILAWTDRNPVSFDAD